MEKQDLKEKFTTFETCNYNFFIPMEKEIKTAEEFYDQNLVNYNLLNFADPATAEQAIRMMEEYSTHRTAQLREGLMQIADKINSGAPPSISKDGEIRHIAESLLKETE